MITLEDYKHAKAAKTALESLNQPVPDSILGIISRYEAQSADMGINNDSPNQQETVSDTPIYDTLKKHSKFGVSKEKDRIVRETVDELISTAPNAGDPGLLLGKIQSGKTDTFENIIGLGFDKGFDIAIVLTKGTKMLAEQTYSRLQKDFRWFDISEEMDNPFPNIYIEDIMNNRGGFNKGQMNRGKTIMVVKKEKTNLDYIIKAFEKDEWMKEKKVLIIDDEADFASRNYQRVNPNAKYDDEGNAELQKSLITLARISQQIDDLRSLPHYCRYLQVTATPYSLYLQPDGNIEVIGGEAKPFKPRFTKLVPIHKGYIGGKQYFVDSKDDESMFSHLFIPVDQEQVDIMGNGKHGSYRTRGLGSKKNQGLGKAMISYLMATAIRVIQNRDKRRYYQSSAIIHVETSKNFHQWEKELVDKIKDQIKDYFLDNTTEDLRIEGMLIEAYDDFSQSIEKARTTGKVNDDGTIDKIDVRTPTLNEIKEEIKKFFLEDEVQIEVVNTDNDVKALLDKESGQLKLKNIANIFIGGSILDRGITVNNLLCFFYGRSTSQQDTVLQHARYYGARSLEDMAVTRLHTTFPIYQRLELMNELDENLRQWFLEGQDEAEPHVTFVGYSKEIEPCAKSKILPSQSTTITSGKILAPKGMNTFSKTEITPTVNKIDKLINETPGYEDQDEDGFFTMDIERAMKILNLIKSTYRYSDKDYNLSQKDDMPQMEAILHYCATQSDGKIWVLHRTNRNMKRIRENGYWIDQPADGRTDLEPAKKKSKYRPVLILLKENGNEMIESDALGNKYNVGWRNAPFYWPVIRVQEYINPVLFAAGQKPDSEKYFYNYKDMIDGLNRDEILFLRLKGEDVEDRFGSAGCKYTLEDAPVETRSIRTTTAKRYLQSDFFGEFALRPGIEIEDDEWGGIYTFNKGEFPFELRPYKYILITSSRRGVVKHLLAELFPVEDWEIFAHQEFCDGDLYDFVDDKTYLFNIHDTFIDKDLATTEVSADTMCQWVVGFPIKTVVKVKEINMKDYDA